MREQLRTIGLISAFLLALGHAVIPHQHFSFSQSAIAAPCESNHSLLDWLGITLSHDLGEGHLEHFQRGQECAFETELLLTCMVLPFLQQFQAPALLCEKIVHQEGPPLSPYFLAFFSESPFRGPPLG